MGDRSSLGPADVLDAELGRLVARLLDRRPEEVEVLDAQAAEVPYAIPAITTASRSWVRGHARVGDAEVPFSFFVKHIQSWARSPLFEAVPEHLREAAEASVAWHTEREVYRSELSTALPPGLSMARAVGVYDLDDKSAAVWLEEVPIADRAWDLGRYAEAARALGRLAASPRVARYAGVSGQDWTVRDYLDGRLSHQVFPLLGVDEVWRHPLVAGAFDEPLRARLLAAVERAEEHVAELMAFPVGTGHGDACPNNLLVRTDGDGFVLIDFGFWGRLPIGYDLGQLLVGDVQTGHRSAEDIAERDEVCVAAYTEGLHVEGCAASAADVRRAHALQLLIFTGYSAVPFELLEAPPTPELVGIAAERATIARYCLDLVDRTARSVPPTA